MSLLSVEAHIRDFFQSREEILLKNYPGLKVERLFTELANITPKLGMDSRKLLESPYSPGQYPFLKLFLAKVEKGIPLEYISGISYFYSSEFVVTPSVLIPRSETELLVEHSLTELRSRLKIEQDLLVSQTCPKDASIPLKVLEIGTGCGAISLSLLKEMQTPLHIHATDISKEALRVAETNKFRLAFTSRDDSKLTLQLADRLEGVVGLWHLIVSNPPYIKDSDRNVKVHQQVDSHEPHLALYLPDSEYHQWFRDFFQQSHNSLLSGGLFLMEGHEDYLIELKEIALQVGFAEVSIIEDYTRRDRFLTARK